MYAFNPLLVYPSIILLAVMQRYNSVIGQPLLNSFRGLSSPTTKEITMLNNSNSSYLLSNHSNKDNSDSTISLDSNYNVTDTTIEQFIKMTNRSLSPRLSQANIIAGFSTLLGDILAIGEFNIMDKENNSEQPTDPTLNNTTEKPDSNEQCDNHTNLCNTSQSNPNDDSLQNTNKSSSGTVYSLQLKIF
jgi:hypothetical protein